MDGFGCWSLALCSLSTCSCTSSSYSAISSRTSSLGSASASALVSRVEAELMKSTKRFSVARRLPLCSENERFR